VAGYFGELAGVNFKKNAEGRDLFFPFGIWGKGRILPDSETATHLRRNAALVSELTMSAIMVGVLVWPFIAINGFQLPIVYVAYPLAALIAGSVMVSIGMWFYNFRFTRSMPVSDDRLTFAETRLAVRQCSLATRRSQRKAMLAWLTVTFAGVCVPWWLGMEPLGPDGRGLASGGFFFVAAIVCFAILVWMIATDRHRSSRP
jgi:hypothetical protein